MIRSVLVIALVVALGACGGEPSKKAPADPQPQAECEAGESQSCECDDGASGTRVCNDDGDFDACECDDPCGEDADGDGVGDDCAVEDDVDQDGIADADDNCPEISNPMQADLDSDQIGDACDDDRDGDGVDDADDNCPNVRNEQQADTNADGIGDACDGDFDGVLDDRDNCVMTPNPGQNDLDEDGLGDECDLDDDGDAVLDDVDNCARVPNADQVDTDFDLMGDECDLDDDQDMIDDVSDNCPLVANPSQRDRQNNGVGDVCDDPDGDGVTDDIDNCPDEANPDQQYLDQDLDGIQDCDERALGTDPALADSDDDGIDDWDELNIHQTDPLNPDSDGDTLQDGYELILGLDPANPSTYNDGILDADRPWLTTCAAPTPATVSSHANVAGGWTIALAGDLSNTAQLQITGANATNAWSASVFRTASGDTTGFVLRYAGVPATGWFTGPFGEFADEYLNHAGDPVERRRGYAVVPAGDLDAERDALLDLAAPFGLADIINLPASSGFVAANAVGYGSITVSANMTTVAVALTDAAAPRFDLLEDLTNGSGLADLGTSRSDTCLPWAPRADTPQLDMYWVLDQSGSMNDDFDRMKANITQMFTTLQNADVDFRMGVVNMNDAIGGRVRMPPGWHTDQTTFVNEIDDFVVDCQGCGSTSGYAEWGLTSAQDGIEWMRSAMAPPDLQIRPDAALVTVFMSDEETQSIQDSPLSGATGQQILTDFEAFFSAETTVYSFTGDATGCGLSDGEAYRAVALATGGRDVSLCSRQLEQSRVELAQLSAAHASPFRLTPRPISATLLVEVNGQPVPRSRMDGYEYFPSQGAIVFFGSYRPQPLQPVAIHYQRF